MKTSDRPNTDREIASSEPRPTGRPHRRTASHPNARARVAVGPDWAGAYLQALELSLGQKIKAATAAGVTPRTIQRRRITDPAFATEEQDRMEVVKDAVESEITRRAIEGVTRQRYDRNGKLISVDVEYSDLLLLRLAERTETGSWRQKHQLEHSQGFVFKTRAERKAALEKARTELKDRPSVGVANSTGAASNEPSVRTPGESKIANLSASGRARSTESGSDQPFSAVMAESRMSNALDKNAWRPSGVAQTG